MKVATKHIFQLVVSLALLFVYLAFTNPVELPLLGLLVPFALIFLVIYHAVNLIIGVYFTGLSLRKKRNISIVVAVATTIYLVIRTLTTVTLRDLVIIVALVAIALLYAFRIAKK